MEKYKKLINNSLIMSVGILGSKLVSFLLLPVYTYYLTTEEYGSVDLVIATVQVLLPIISVSMYQAILRFTMEQDSDKAKVLSNTTLVSIGGILLFLLIYPILSYYNIFGGSIKYLYLILFVQIFEKNLLEYVRAIGKLKLFAADGILLSLLLAVFNIIFIVGFNKGIVGYFWAMILAYICSIINLLIFSDAIRSFNVKSINAKYALRMVKYSLPLIPNTVMWWIINASSRYIISFFVGVGANGIFAVASRIPALINIGSQVFNQAWQLSAVEEYDKRDSSAFYSNVFKVFYVTMLIGLAFIMLINKPIFQFIFAESYYTGWQVTPFLLIGSFFSALSSFLGTNYVASKASYGVLKTSIIGGIVSIILNFILIPLLGIIGAGISSAISFYLMFLVRYKDSIKYVFITIDWKYFYSNILLILFQIVIMFLNLNLGMEIVINLIVVIIILLINFRIMKSFFKQIFSK